MKSISHVTRVRWQWPFGIAFVAYGVSALVKRWIFWNWGGDWQIVDLAVEPGAVLIGWWLVRAAMLGTRERLKYGAVVGQMSPNPARPEVPFDLVLRVPSGIEPGERLQLALVCQFAEPDSDGVNYTERWRMERAGVAQAGVQGVEVRERFEPPETAAGQFPSGQNYEVVTLHVSHAGGLDREFKLDWRSRP